MFNILMDSNKLLGQHFLINKKKIEEIISFIPQEKQMIEIGAGTGSLTDHITQKDNLTVIEIDKRMTDTLRQKYNSLKIIQNDCLMEKIETQVLFGNLPYNISTQFLLKLCTEILYEEGYFMLQKEVVNRLIAKENNKNYGALSVIVQLHGVVKELIYLRERDFSPSPKVQSTFFSIIPKKQIKKDFVEFVFRCFRFRRKKFKNICSIGIDKRPDQVPPEDFLSYFNTLSSSKNR